MKRLLLALVVIALVLSSCDVLMPSGKAGKTFVSYDRDKSIYLYDYNDYYYYSMTVYKAYLDLPGGFPDTITLGQDYDITPGSYTGTALLYAWDSYNSYSTYKYNGTQYWLNGDAATWASKSTRYTTFTYTLKANPGKQGFLSAGANGTDKHYAIYLTWDPASWSVTSKSLVAMTSKVLSATADKIVKEFTDDDNTITLEINLNNSASAAPSAGEMVKPQH